MPLDPAVWSVPPLYRRFPDHVAEIYESEETALHDLLELWNWRWDLVRHTPMGPQPDATKQANRLGQEVSDFLRIEEEYKAVLEEAELPLRLKELGEAALDWREAREKQDPS